MKKTTFRPVSRSQCCSALARDVRLRTQAEAGSRGAHRRPRRAPRSRFRRRHRPRRRRRRPRPHRRPRRPSDRRTSGPSSSISIPPRCRESARATLDQNAKLLRDHSSSRVLIEGHCDERGTVEYNQALGEKRAQAARDYLVAAGIAASSIDIISYGKERPVDPGHDEAAWAQNRRAQFSIKS